MHHSIREKGGAFFIIYGLFPLLISQLEHIGNQQLKLISVLYGARLVLAMHSLCLISYYLYD